MRSDAQGMIAQIESLFPKVKEVIAASQFSQDAIKRAEMTLERAKGAIAQQDVGTLADSLDGLKRTLATFQNLAARTQ
jgi:hypothetical protein